MSLFILIVILIMIAAVFLESKGKKENNENLERAAQMIRYILGAGISFFANFMAGINFAVSSGSLVPIFIIALIKTGIMIFAHKRKNSKLKWIMVILLISDILALFISMGVLSQNM